MYFSFQRILRSVVANHLVLPAAVFKYYLEGMSLNGISEKTGIGNSHGGIAAILTKRCYLGDRFYPAIVDAETFSRATEEKERRAKKLNRLNQFKPRPHRTVPAEFFFTNDVDGTATEEDTPARGAERLYGRIQIKNIKENTHGQR